MNYSYPLKIVIPAIACLVLAACSGGDSSNSSSGTGSLSVSISDAPLHEAQAVNVHFIGARVQYADGDRLNFYFCEDPVNPGIDPPVVQDSECVETDPEAVTIDLLQQTGGASALLIDGAVVPAGRVVWVRLILDDPAGDIILSSGKHVLTVPSGAQTGLKLNRGFEVPEDGEAAVYIDFDVRKSIVEVHSSVPPSYKLKPSLRIVTEFGAIAGEVDNALLVPGCLGPSIYIFKGASAAIDDIDGDKGDPLTSAPVVADVASATGYSYRADFLDPGDYRLAFVCAGGISQDGGVTFDEPADDPEQEDILSFTPAAETGSVVIGQTDTVNF